MVFRRKAPDSILEKSRRSLSTTRRLSELSWIMEARFLWCSPRSVSKRSSAIPITPFMGVRISWLIWARNSDLAALARSASSLASLIRTSASLRSVISSPTPWMNCSLSVESKKPLFTHLSHLFEPSEARAPNSWLQRGESGVRSASSDSAFSACSSRRKSFILRFSVFSNSLPIHCIRGLFM